MEFKTTKKDVKKHKKKIKKILKTVKNSAFHILARREEQDMRIRAKTLGINY